MKLVRSVNRLRNLKKLQNLSQSTVDGKKLDRLANINNYKLLMRILKNDHVPIITVLKIIHDERYHPDIREYANKKILR